MKNHIETNPDLLVKRIETSAEAVAMIIMIAFALGMVVGLLACWLIVRGP